MKKRIDDIEILRAFAVLWVVLHHAHQNLIVWSTPALERFYAYFGGWSGVDLFFAISGFVIARDLVPRLQASGDQQQFLRQTIGFWIRRAYRLLPSAWLCLTFIVAASMLFNASGAFGSVRANVAGAIAAALQLANLHFAGNFGGPLGFGATFHFWSLSLEEQFYLLLPFVVFFSGRALPWVAGAVIVFQLLSVRPNLYYWTFRTDAMLLGVMIATWSRSSSYRLFEPFFLQHSKLLRAAVLLCLTGAISVVASDQLRIVEYRVSLIALLAALLVLIASYDRDYLLAPGLIKTVLMWVGSRSYAIYLWHVPVFFTVRELAFRYSSHTGIAFNESNLLEFVLAGASLLALMAELNYRIIEMPLRQRGAQAAKRWLQETDTADAQPASTLDISTRLQHSITVKEPQ